MQINCLKLGVMAMGAVMVEFAAIGLTNQAWDVHNRVSTCFQKLNLATAAQEAFVEEANAAYLGDPSYYEMTFDKCQTKWARPIGFSTILLSLIEDDCARYQNSAKMIDLQSIAIMAALADVVLMATAYLAYRKFCAR